MSKFKYKVAFGAFAAAGAVGAWAPVADAGAIRPACVAGGVVMIDSTDPAVLQYPTLWDFYVKSVTVDGGAVPFHRVDHDSFATDGPVREGAMVEVLFQQVRNDTDAGDGHQSGDPVAGGTIHRFVAVGCPPASSSTTSTPTTTPSTTTTIPSTTTPSTSRADSTTTAAAPTTASTPSTSGSVASESGASTLPATGVDSAALLSIAAIVAASGIACLWVRTARRA